MQGVSDKLKIRRYRESDKVRVERMFDDFEDFLASIDNLGRLARKRSLIRRGYGAAYLKKTLREVSKGDGFFYIAEVEGKIAGFVSGLICKASKIQIIETKRKELYGFITEIYVESSYWGSGVAKLLMNEAEKYLKGKGCTCISLDVFAPNGRARRFYEKSGYLERSVTLVKECSWKAAGDRPSA